MSRRQHGLTVLTPILPGREGDLRAVLARIEADVEANDLVPFLSVTTVHFARWVILPEVRADGTLGAGYPAQLVFSSSYDGPLVQHLAELDHVAGDGLRAVYRNCVGFGDRPTPPDLPAYLRAHALEADVLYVGAPGLDVDRIRREADLREALEAFLDREAAVAPWRDHTPEEVRAALVSHVAEDPRLAWALEAPGPRVPTLPWYGWAGLTVGAVLLSPLLLAAWGAIRIRELTESDEAVGIRPAPTRVGPPEAGPEQGAGSREDGGTGRGGSTDPSGRAGSSVAPGAGPDVAAGEAGSSGASVAEVVAHNTRARLLAEDEDYIVQNQLSHVVEVRPGWFRKAVLRGVLAVLQFGGRRIYTRGSLFGVSTLHFVRWLFIDGGRRLLFLTNYDGSMVGYVGDFVNKSWQIPSALTAIWSNTRGFPPTRWLVGDGARDIPAFTAFLREHQVPSLVWYSAYKRLTTGNIVNNAEIRRGLTADMTPEETRAWLRRF